MSHFTSQELFHIAASYEYFRSPILVQQHKYQQKLGKHSEVPSVQSIKNIFHKATEDGNLGDSSRPG